MALRQANLRGFFTYSDLAASCDVALLSVVARAVSAACAAAALSYLASLVTLLASTLVMSQAWLPTLPAADTNIMTQHNHSMNPAPYLANTTLDHLPDLPSAHTEEPVLEKPKCCSKWQQYHHQDRVQTKKNWYDTVVAYDWKSFEPWWCRTPLLNWLYHNSLIDPMQRWLERFDEYTSLFRKKLFNVGSAKPTLRCHEYVNGDEKQQCVRQWLNLSKLSVLMASISDR